MIKELTTLERKVAEVSALCRALRNENDELRQQVENSEKDKKGNYQLYPYRQITKDDEKPIRAFIFQKAGRTCIIYWHMNGTGQLTLDIEKNKLSLMNESGKRIPIRSAGSKSILPAAGRLILETALPQEEVIKLFRKSIEIIK